MNNDEKSLLKRYRELSDTDKETLNKFADFLVSTGEPEIKEIPEPVQIEAADNETVVGALKRLSAIYPMLDKAKMLNETSALMAQHVMQGRDKTEVINELVIVFEKHYELIKKESDSK